MNNSSSFLILLLYSLFLDALPVEAGKPKPLGDEEIEEVCQSLHQKWEPANYNSPFGFEAVFRNLNPFLWPALPESYEWRIENQTVHLYKHREAEDHDFDFVTYPTDTWMYFDFLSRWDDTTYHSFAYTRTNSPLSAEDPARNNYPIDSFQYGAQTYMRGHCIDFLDTFGLSERSRIPSGRTVIESISTFDPRNYIPEPINPSAYWGETVRKNRVGKIREEGGCYMQYMYYEPGAPKRTTDVTATLIPQGIYFVDLNGKLEVQASYHVPWSNHPIHTEADGGKSWQARLQETADPNGFFPSPFVHMEERKFEILPSGYTLPPLISYKDYYRLVRIADHEALDIRAKSALICYLLTQPTTPPRKIRSWLKRLIDHAIEIHEKGSFGFIANSIGEILGHNAWADFDQDNIFSDWLNQLVESDKPKAKRGRALFDEFRSLEEADTPPGSPIPEIDVDKDKYMYDMSPKVIAALKENKSLTLVNVTTKRADAIAAVLNADEELKNKKKDIKLQYTLKKGSPQTSGVRAAFTNIGLNPVELKIVDDPGEGTSGTASPAIPLTGAFWLEKILGEETEGDTSANLPEDEESEQQAPASSSKGKKPAKKKK